jgi:eukaryotic-like serine/threonine-protein kinase
MRSFLSELKRRNVFKVAITYAIIAWVLIQASSIILPTFDAPRWAVQTITFLILLGFPVAVVLAWAYDLTPDGIRPASPAGADVAPTAGSRSDRGLDRVLSLVLIVMLALALPFVIANSGLFPGGRTAAEWGGEAPALTASIVLPEGLRLGMVPGGAGVTLASPAAGRFALSPDGRHLVVVASDPSGRAMLWLRPLDSGVVQALTGTEDGQYPFWSPDSRSIAFIAGGRLKRFDLAGSSTITLAEATLGATGTWNRDGVILFTPRGGGPIHRISDQGGESTPVTALDEEGGETQHWYPWFLPDGRSFLYFSVGAPGDATRSRAVMVGSLDAPGVPGRLLVEPGSNAKFANGHLLFARGGTLVAQVLDPETLELEGEPAPVVESLQIAGLGATGTAGAFSVSDNGMLVYQLGAGFRSQLAWFDRSGAELERLGEPADYADVRLSPDGARAAVSVMDPMVGTRDLWTFDVARGVRVRQTFDAADDFAPVWSPDGSELVFTSWRNASIDLYRKRAGADEELLFSDALGQFVSDWSPDGRFIVYVAGGGVILRSDIWILPLGRGDRAHPFAASPFPETHGQFSPDGRWLAYTSAETGRLEVYVSPFPGPGEKQQVSTAGGGWPRWSRDGTELFYLSEDNTLTAVAVDGSGGTFGVRGEERLFGARPRPRARLDAYPYDVALDGRRFLINVPVGEPVPMPVTLVVNWTSLLSGR